MDYSEYPDAPDIESATAEYRNRFSGSVGEWFLSVQSDITGAILGQCADRKGEPLEVLDVGGGHGQNVATVLGGGHRLTVVGSNPECGALLYDVDSPRFRYVCGKMLDLPFRDRQFDLVLSYRMLAHIGDWHGFVNELSRVSRSQVAVDYPTMRSANAVSSIFYSGKKKLERYTREFRVFSERDIHAGMRRTGLSLHSRFPQFFFPMAVHRALKSSKLSAGMEFLPRIMRLTQCFGSPVIALYSKDNECEELV